MIDLDAVCARHGITVRAVDALFAAATLDAAGVIQQLRSGETPAEAVGALLKARYNVKAWFGAHHTARLGAWWAKVDAERHPLSLSVECADTELAAVVVLADRLQAVARRDLDAVCARHGITVRDTAADQPDPAARFVASGAGVETDVRAATAEVAVCALLTTRWGITARLALLSSASEGWEARVSGGSSGAGDSEFAAVVALADQLQGVA